MLYDFIIKLFQENIDDDLKERITIEIENITSIEGNETINSTSCYIECNLKNTIVKIEEPNKEDKS